MRRALATIAVVLLTAGSSPASRHARRPADSPAPACNSSQVGTFIGVDSYTNYAGASDSGVLAGFYNGACDARDSIFDGQDNVIAGNGYATDSFIGAGQTNLINDAYSTTAANSFIGAGESGTVGAGNSALVTGNANAVEAGQAFAGAGKSNAVGGGYSGVVAGLGNSTIGTYAFVGSGYHNAANGTGSFVGAGGYEYFSGTATVLNAVTGMDAFVGSGDENSANSLEDFVGAGVDNVASAANQNFVGGGDQNSASGGGAFTGAGLKNTASSLAAFAGGGYGNVADGQGSFVGAGGSLYFSGQVKAANATGHLAYDSFVGAGDGNAIGSAYGVIGSGAANTISAPITKAKVTVDAAEGAIVGGQGNSIVAASGYPSAEFDFIGGGLKNTVKDAGSSTIGGGNTNLASAANATIPGGTNNSASGIASFAAGTGSTASTNGSFVWSDAASGATALATSANYQFLARASGGVKFYSNPTLASGVSLAPGSGAWASLSDRTMKTGIATLDDRSILDRLSSLPIAEWSYRSEDSHVRHIGPMAQDFYAAFHVGEDDRHIASIDEGGVALAALKAVHAETRAARDGTAHVRERLDAMQRADDARIDALENRAAFLEHHLPRSIPKQ